MLRRLPSPRVLLRHLRQVREGVTKVVDGVLFGVRGVKLLFQDIGSAGKLFWRAVRGEWRGVGAGGRLTGVQQPRCAWAAAAAVLPCPCCRSATVRWCCPSLPLILPSPRHPSCPPPCPGAGGTLKPREVQALRRTIRDLLAFVPVTIIRIIPLTPLVRARWAG